VTFKLILVLSTKSPDCKSWWPLRAFVSARSVIVFLNGTNIFVSVYLYFDLPCRICGQVIVPVTPWNSKFHWSTLITALFACSYVRDQIYVYDWSFLKPDPSLSRNQVRDVGVVYI